MYGKRGYKTFIDTDVKNAPMLFAKAISIGVGFAVEAKKALEAKNIEKRYQYSEKLLNLSLLLRSCINEKDEKNKQFVLTMVESFNMIADLVSQVELEADKDSCDVLIGYMQKLNRTWEEFDAHLKSQEAQNSLIQGQPQPSENSKESGTQIEA